MKTDRKRICWIVGLLSAAFVMSDCTPRRSIEIETPERVFFLQQNILGVYSRGTQILVYDQADFQLAVSPKRHLFRLQDDGQHRYAQVVFETPPRREGDLVQAHCQYKVGNLNLNLKIQMEYLLSANDKYWLWNDQHQLGFLIPAATFE